MKTAANLPSQPFTGADRGFFLPKHRPPTHRPVRRSLGEGGNTSSVPFSPATPFPRPPVFAEGFDRQAGPTQWLFQGPPAESKFLAVTLRVTPEGGEAFSVKPNAQGRYEFPTKAGVQYQLAW